MVSLLQVAKRCTNCRRHYGLDNLFIYYGEKTCVGHMAIKILKFEQCFGTFFANF